MNSVESHTPEFLRQLVDMKDVGVTLQTAIGLISNSKLGVLSQELVMTSEDIRRGATTINALVRMEERIGLVSVKRAMSLLVKASEVTDYIKDVLIIAINDFEHYLKLKKDRFNIAITYVMISTAVDLHTPLIPLMYLLFHLLRTLIFILILQETWLICSGSGWFLGFFRSHGWTRLCK